MGTHISKAVPGRLYILAAAVMWSTSGLFTKTSLFDDWPLEERGLLMAFWRALFAGLLLAPAIRRPRMNWKLAPMAGCFAVMSVAYLNAVTMNTAANAIWLQSTAPLWIFIYTLILLRTPPKRRDAAPLTFCALGLGIILFYEFTSPAAGNSSAISSGAANFSSMGVAYGLVAGACYGAVVMFIRSLRSENVVWLVAVNHLFTAAVLAPFVIYLDRWPDIFTYHGAAQLLVLAGFGLFQMGLPYLLFMRGLQRISGQEASLIALLEPVLVPAWVFFVLGNTETQWWTLVGGCLILTGLVIRYWPKRGSAAPL